MASIASIAVIMTVTGLALFFYGLERFTDLVRAQTILFTFLVAVEVVRIQVIRSRYELSLVSNPWLIGAIAVTLLLQMVVLYTPLSDWFAVRPPSIEQWAWIGIAFVGFLVLNLGTNALFDRVFAASERFR
jgi:Ca2+-transporting ATPase